VEETALLLIVRTTRILQAFIIRLKLPLLTVVDIMVPEVVKESVQILELEYVLVESL